MDLFSLRKAVGAGPLAATRYRAPQARGRAVALTVSLAFAVLAALIVPLPAESAAPIASTVIQVNSDNTTQSQNETSIAINPTNPMNLVGGSITFETGVGQCAAYSSADGGNTWTHFVLPNAPGFQRGGDPVVAFGPDGTAYYLCMNLIPGPRTQYLFRSTQGGAPGTWGAPVPVFPTTEGVTDDDKGHLAVDDYAASPSAGNIYAAATRGPCGPGDIWFARSPNGSAGFQQEQQVNDGGIISHAANVAVGANGDVYVAWRDMNGCPQDSFPQCLVPQATNGIFIDKSTDGGQTFNALIGGADHLLRGGPITSSVRPMEAPPCTPQNTIPPNQRGNGNPVLGAHPTNPNIVYAVWGEDPAGLDDSDIMFARSVDGGNTWSAPAPIRVNDDVNPPGEFFSQWWPWLAVDPTDGEIDIVWYSDQNDANRSDGTPFVDVYFSSSTDDGLTFGPSVRLTPTASDFSPKGAFFGDYQGIDSFDGVAHPFWTDTTLGGEGDQDVATMAVGGPDLSITKTDSPDPVQSGGTLTYTVTVTNNGPTTATGVTVTDTLPANVTFVGATPSQGTCSQAAGTVTCALGSLASGAVATVTIQVTPNAPGTITNTATVTANEPDRNPSNNSDTETTTVGQGPVVTPPPGQTQNQTQSQCNNTSGGSSGIALAGLSLGAINLALGVPVGLQLSCLVNVLGPNQGQTATQASTP